MPLTAVLWLVSPICAGPPSPPPITQLKPLYPRTVLVQNGAPRCVVVRPDASEYEAVAHQFVELVRRQTGATLPVMRASALVDDDWKISFAAIGSNDLVALGNVNNNRLLSVLYGQRYVVADSIYPGAGGYVIRTVHDPFAKGINVLVLGGSDAAGVQRAMSAFADKLAKAPGRDLALDQPVIDVAFEKKAYRFFPDASHSLSSKRQPQYTGMQWFREQLQQGGFMDAEGSVSENRRPGKTLVALTGMIARIGQTYFRTGNPELPPLMKELLDKNRYLLTIPEPLDEMQARAAGHVHEWDLLEELPVWTDEDRLDITNALLRDAAIGHERRGFHGQVEQGAVMALDENHGTSSARNSFRAWQYFEKYYPSAASHYWMRCAKAVFSAQASTYQILEDAAGYLCYCPIQTMDYALRSGDLTYFKRGIARHHARYIAMACMNNLGLSAGFGDSPSLVVPGFFEALAPAAWFHRDPELYWIVRNKLHVNCGLRIFQNSIAFDLDVEPREPTEWTGLIRIPLYEAPLAKGDSSDVPVFAERKDVDPKLFNKLVFRENWDEDGQYLLLDGAGVWDGPPGPHGHKHNDINSIVNFTAQGRMWLVDHTYQVRAFQDHSALYVLCNGSGGYRKRTLAELQDLMETNTYGLSRTRFLNWERAIFWKKGSYFVVVDTAFADNAGDYFARCSLRALGEAELRGSDLYLSQDGKFCKILSDGAANVDIEQYRYTDPHWDSFYPHAEPVVRIFQQDKHRELEAGGRIGFINLLYAYGSKDDENRVALRPVSESCATVVEDEAETLLGVGKIPGGLGTANLFVISPDSVLVAGASSLPGGLVTAETACNLALDAPRQELIVESTRDTWLRLAGRVNAVHEGTKELELQDGTLNLSAGQHVIRLRRWDGFSRLSELATKALAAARRQADERAEEVRQRAGKEEIQGLEVDAVKLDMSVATLIVADVTDDGANEWIIGGDNGVGAYRPDGTRLWLFETEQPVRCLDVADIDGDGKPEVVAGGMDEHVRLLDANGRERWSFRCKPSAGSIDGPPAVDYVKVADLEGDGSKEVVVGANWVHVLDAAGKLKWEKYMAFRRGRITGDFVAGDVADLDRDGKQEVIGLFMTSYPLAIVYDTKGNIVMPADGPGGHGGLNIDVPFAVATMDLFGGGAMKQVICGCTSQIGFYWHDQKNKEQAGGKVGGTFVSMAHWQPDPGKRPIIFGADSMCGIRAIQPDPRRNDRWITAKSVWYRSLDEKITALLAADLDGDGTGELIAGTKMGNVYVLDASDGSVRGFARPAGARGRKPGVTSLAPDPGSQCVLVGRRDGAVLRVALRG